METTVPRLARIILMGKDASYYATVHQSNVTLCLDVKRIEVVIIRGLYVFTYFVKLQFIIEAF